ncbi:hypothetical protein C8Q76DRAFT_794728 [Earliella scabrosa]|nr:hypothetical protein C8Q76DRAFT_794728 [Earliella scabrosa]
MRQVALTSHHSSPAYHHLRINQLPTIDPMSRTRSRTKCSAVSKAPRSSHSRSWSLASQLTTLTSLPAFLRRYLSYRLNLSGFSRTHDRTEEAHVGSSSDSDNRLNLPAASQGIVGEVECHESSGPGHLAPPAPQGVRTFEDRLLSRYICRRSPIKQVSFRTVSIAHGEPSTSHGRRHRGGQDPSSSSTQPRGRGILQREGAFHERMRPYWHAGSGHEPPEVYGRDPASLPENQNWQVEWGARPEMGEVAAIVHGPPSLLQILHHLNDRFRENRHAYYMALDILFPPATHDDVIRGAPIFARILETSRWRRESPQDWQGGIVPVDRRLAEDATFTDGAMDGVTTSSIAEPSTSVSNHGDNASTHPFPDPVSPSSVRKRVAVPSRLRAPALATRPHSASSKHKKAKRDRLDQRLRNGRPPSSLAPLLHAAVVTRDAGEAVSPRQSPSFSGEFVEGSSRDSLRPHKRSRDVEVGDDGRETKRSRED